MRTGARDARRDARRARSRAAFTLIELLVVISLIALLLGIGVGAFARLDAGRRVAASLVEDVLRSAHNWAVAREAPARVRIDPAAGTIRAEGLAVVGTWRFETLPIEGAFGLDGANLGGQLVDGFVGRAISFSGEPTRSRAELFVERDPAWDPRLGFSLRCALSRGAGGSGTVVDAGGAFGLEVASGGALRGWISSEAVEAETGATRRGPRSMVETAPGLLAPRRWTQVELRYDRRRLALLVDGVPVAEEDEEAPVWRLEGPLVISPDATPWDGALDELVVAMVAGADEARLPRGIAFAAGTPREIAFAAGGGLDRAVHQEPVRFALELEDGERRPIEVSLHGMVE